VGARPAGDPIDLHCHALFAKSAKKCGTRLVLCFAFRVSPVWYQARPFVINEIKSNINKARAIRRYPSFFCGNESKCPASVQAAVV
jgi:hypothetical protein